MRKAALDEAGQRKSDMVAWKACRVQEPLARRPPSYGHIAGVAVGDVFGGRVETAVLTLHSAPMKGVDSAGSTMGAFAVCLSGGKKDDADEGATFWYTGVGGQSKGAAKQQVSDQEYSHHDNAALVTNHDSGTPVRVFRQRRLEAGGGARGAPNDSSGAEARVVYVYEGLYSVVQHRRVPSQDGPLVCQFKLEAVPGHSVVSARVQYMLRASGGSSGSRRGRLRFERLMLAGAAAGGAPRGASGGGSGRESSRPAKARQEAPSDFTLEFAVPTREVVANRIAARAVAGAAGRLVCADISGGLEQVSIPVWNDADNDDAIPVEVQDDADSAAMQEQEGPGAAAAAAADGDDVDEQFNYMADYTFGKVEAKSLAIRAEQHFRSHFPHLCGIQYHGGHSCYTNEGRLANTDSCGVMECDPDCTRLGAANNSSSCKGNSVLHKGIRYPLEVFKVPGKGWGVRCSVDISVGAVLCACIGTVITDSTAELLRGCDRYLFNLDHFIDLLEEQQPLQDGQQQQQQAEQQQQQQQQQKGEQQQQRLPPPPRQQQQAEQQQAGAQQQQPLSPPPPPLQQQQQQQAQQQPRPLGSTLGRSLSAAAAAASGGSLSGRKRQKQQQSDDVGWDDDDDDDNGGEAAAAAAGADAAGRGGSSAQRVQCLCGAANCCKWLLVN